MSHFARPLFVLAVLFASFTFGACGGVDADDTPAASTTQALNACNAAYTCPTPKTCGTWSAYSDCGTVGTTCLFNESCGICGRGSCNNGGYQRYRQRTRNCTLTGGVPCVEWQVGGYLSCDCSGAF